MQQIVKTTRTVLLCLMMAIMTACYSFSGASVPPHLRTVAVPLFGDRSQAGIAQFRETLTRSLIDRITVQGSLTVEPDIGRADAVLDASIVSFSDEPSQLGSTSERAVTNRVTIVVMATYEDRVKNDRMFSQSFVGFADYPVGHYEAQQAAIRTAIDQVADDLFNKMISDW
jgi:hypothetical protein